MPLAEVGDRPKVRLVLGREQAKRDVFTQPPLDLP
jgi:hypothetical protein